MKKNKQVFKGCHKTKNKYLKIIECKIYAILKELTDEHPEIIKIAIRGKYEIFYETVKTNE